MRQHGWRLLAWAAAASLGSFVAGCGDDSGNGMDLTAGNADLTVVMMPDMAVDASMSPDMALAAGAGAVNAFDVLGNVYQPSDKDAGTGESQVPLVHMMIAQASFAQYSKPSDFNGLVINKMTFTLSGCDANTYDAVTPGHLPDPDVKAGDVTVTGYDTHLMVPGPTTVGNPYGLYGPIPGTITCKNPAPGSTLPFYGCNYTAGGTATPVDGLSTNAVVFPPVPLSAFVGACGVSGAGCTAANECGTADQVTVGATTYCLQPLWPTGNAANLATLNVPGGNGYNAGMSKIGTGGSTLSNGAFPDNVVITSIQSPPGTELAHPAGVPLIGDLTGNLNANNDVQIQWACAPGATGTGCSTDHFTNHVSLVGVSSTNPRTEFAITPKYGTLTCFEKGSKAGSTMTVPKAAIAALIKNQSGGSAQLMFIHFEADAILTGNAQIHAAGHGQFDFVKIP